MSVTAEDVGSGFKAATFDDPSAVARRKNTRIILDPLQKLQLVKVREQPGPRDSQFLHGDSRFFCTLFKKRKPQQKPKPDQPPAKKPFGSEKPNPVQTQKFRQSLRNNIHQVSNFFLDELSPKTLALATSLDRVRNITSQWIDDPIDLPTQFIHSRAMRAVEIRLVRYLCQYFDLTKEECALMLSEFDRKLNL
jgi:hypothetical protein